VRGIAQLDNRGSQCSPSFLFQFFILREKFLWPLCDFYFFWGSVLQIGNTSFSNVLQHCWYMYFSLFRINRLALYSIFTKIKKYLINNFLNLLTYIIRKLYLKEQKVTPGNIQGTITQRENITDKLGKRKYSVRVAEMLSSLAWQLKTILERGLSGVGRGYNPWTTVDYNYLSSNRIYGVVPTPDDKGGGEGVCDEDGRDWDADEDGEELAADGDEGGARLTAWTPGLKLVGRGRSAGFGCLPEEGNK
jgi:hypothetical protein